MRPPAGRSEAGTPSARPAPAPRVNRPPLGLGLEFAVRGVVERDRAEPCPARRRPAAPGLAWWPGSEWRTDLPLLAERVDDPAEPPPVLVAHRRGFGRAGGYRQ